MNDAGNPIQIDIQSAIISCFEEKQAAIRYNLGYISGVFSKNITADDLYVKIHYQRGINLEWESIQYKLNSGRKTFRQKLPQGLTVAAFYVQLYGWIAPQPDDPNLTAEFELTDFELSVKEIPIGKFGGEPLGVDTTQEPPVPPTIPPFEMYLDVIGDVQATEAKAVWFTTHEATSKVIYGSSPQTMYEEIEDLTFTQLHSIIIGGLGVGKTYYAQFFSTSKITGQTISSDIKSFTTGDEITIFNIIKNPDIEFNTKTINQINIYNMFGDTDMLLTLQPDAEDNPYHSADFELLSKTVINVTNTITNEYDTSLS